MYSLKRTIIPGQMITVDCPACGSSGVPASSREIQETVSVVLITVMRLRNTLLTCDGCGAKLQSRRSLDELALASPDEINASLFVRESFIINAIPVFTLLVCWIPLFGFLLSLVGYGLFRWLRGSGSLFALGVVIFSFVWNVMFFTAIILFAPK